MTPERIKELRQRAQEDWFPEELWDDWDEMVDELTVQRAELEALRSQTHVTYTTNTHNSNYIITTGSS